MHRNPQRTCVQCGSKTDKRSLLRIAGKAGAGWKPDPEGGRPGRGFYLCRKSECVEGFVRRIRTPKGAARWKMGTSGAALGEQISAWWAGAVNG
ncbi:MAG: YlxR family protein [Deltaproteobacteria bacterium]|nr:YlxR family protein [Deltaproteobacteria bacterium]